MVVLVVDDDAVSRLVIEHILQRGGHETVAADSAEQASRELAELDGPVSLVVCDYMLPGANGLDLFEALSADPGAEVPPFVLLTGVSDANDLDDERVELLSGYLTKPVKSSELLALVQSLATGG